MSKINLTPNASGTGVFTIASPNSNTDYTFTLPEVTGGDFIVSDSSGNVTIGGTTPGNAGTVNVSVGSPGSTVGGLQLWSTTSGSHFMQFGDVASGDGYYRGAIGYLHSSDALVAYSAGSERMRIDSSGNVGIGTTSPSTYDSRTNNLVVGDSGDAGITIFSGATSNAYLQFAPSGDTGLNNGLIDYDNNNDSMAFATGGSERMRIDANGSLGIATTPPSTTVHPQMFIGDNFTIMGLSGSRGMNITTNAYYNSGWKYRESGYVQMYNHDNSGSHVWYNAASGTANAAVTLNEVMRIDASGNVGIGTTSPSSYYATELVVNCADEGGITLVGGTTEGQYLMFADGTSGNSQYRGFIAYDHSVDAFTVNSRGDVRFNSGSLASEAMRIDSSGNLLVGTSSATVSGAAGFGVLPAGNAAASPFVFSSSDASVDSHVTWAAYSRGVGAYRFYVGYGGTVFATSTSITALSDESLKENIRDLDKGLETINALQPRRFDWKNGDGNNIMGFVAQEVEGVMPELVHEYAYSKEETKLGLKMGDMVPSMVKAIQELSAQVNELKAEVAALEAR